MVKYNGKSFEDLTPKFLDAMSQTVKASWGVKNQTTAKPQTNYKNIILIIVVALLFVSVVNSIAGLRRR